MFDENKDEDFDYGGVWYVYDSVFGKRFYQMVYAATSNRSRDLVRKRISRNTYMNLRKQAGIE